MTMYQGELYDEGIRVGYYVTVKVI